MVDLITGGRTKPNSRTQLLKQDDQRHNLICRCKLILPPSVDRHCFSTQPLQAHRSQQEGWLSGSCVAPEGAEGLDGAGPEDVLVVEGRDGRADEGADPEDPVVIPWLVLVVDDGGAEAPGGVDAGAGDGDGGQVDHEHGEPDGERRQHLRNSHTHTRTGQRNQQPRNQSSCMLFFSEQEGKKKKNFHFPEPKAVWGQV
jgi:hypothetical protein